MISTLAFVFKIIKSIIFSVVKKFFHKQRVFLDQTNFLQTNIFPGSSKSSTNKEVLHKQIFSLIKEVFHKQVIFHKQRSFPQSSNIFPQTMIGEVF